MEYRKENLTWCQGFECYAVDTNGVVYTKKDTPFKTSLNPSGYEIVDANTG